jgi:predicted nucleotidyltransferase
VRDRDYLVDRHGVVFSVIGDVHPPSHYIGFAKYHPSVAGDRTLFGRRYERNGSLKRSASILADRPECVVHSPALGCKVTGVPRHDVVAHYSTRAALSHLDRDRFATFAVGRDLLSIVDRLLADGAIDHLGVTGSFLIGCPNDASDIDLACYGPAGVDTAQRLFADRQVIRPYVGADFARLCRRRALDLPGTTWDTLTRRERRRLQGRTVRAGAHVNCEPLRADDDLGPAPTVATTMGDVTVVALITDHESALATPAWYRVEVERVVSSSIDDAPAPQIRFLRSYLGAYRGTFRAGERISACGQLLALQPGDDLMVELTDWTGTRSYGARLVE